MTYAISAIQQILDATWLQEINKDAQIDHLLTDSRQVVAPAFALFFALKGKRHDGHKHIEQAYQHGVRHFVVSKKPTLKNFPEANFLQVPDTLLALQQLAAAHRAHFDELTVIGITGSNGKTIVKEWLWQILSPDFKVVRSPKSYNSQIGVPLSLWQIQAHHQIAIIEAGISQPGEMQRLSDMIRPRIGIFTNLGPAHQEGFQDDAEKVCEKMLLFQDVECLIMHETPGLKVAMGKRDVAVPGNVICWRIRGEAEIGKSETGVSLDDSETGVSLDVSLNPLANGKTEIMLFPVQNEKTSAFLTTPQHFILPFSDPASIENAVHCWLAAHYLGCSAEAIAERMLLLEPVEMRLELKAGIQNSIVINDAYNNDISSLKIALQFARQQARQGKMMLVLSDILQSGQDWQTLWKEVSEVLRQYMGPGDRLVGIGKDIQHLKQILPADLFQQQPVFFTHTSDFIAQVAQMDFRDQVVLLKGARNFEFERIATRLEQKAHKTVLEVNLSAMVHNLNTYNRLLRPGTQMMAMVKAAGYGSGSAEVAKLLEFHKVDYLGVAYTDEGIELRKAGVQTPILVLNPERSGFDAMFRFRLEPEIYSLALLEELIRYCGTEKRMDVHLKLDTGMHRLGFEAQDLPLLQDYLRKYPNLEVKTVFSHLSASDNPAHDAFTHQQAHAFSNLYEGIVSVLPYRPLRHICNTGGIARFPEYHFDMVRLGIGLYGIDSSGLQSQLRVVNALKATISQIKTISAGDTVGYNRNSGVLEQQRRIATISIGYADGFLRLAGGGRYSVGIHGQLAPTIGNVCMDMTMVDVTHIPAAQAGDEVVVFGAYPDVQSLANCLQTIPYEVFTNISERVKRVYWAE